MNEFQVIATLNSHLLVPATLKQMVESGATIFRLNGSHLKVDEVEVYCREIRKAIGNQAKILVDLPGNKIRTAVLAQPVILKAGKSFELRGDQLNYPQFFESLAPGDTLLANDSLFRFQVEAVTKDRATLLSLTDGELKSNKGVHLLGKHPPLPFLFERDRKLIQASAAAGVDLIGFSFVRTPADVAEAHLALKGTALVPIIKVETAQAIENLEVILDAAEQFLVDRGDLSCDVGIENVDFWQKRVLNAGLRKGKKIYFATQFLHSMVYNNLPLIAEVCGLSDAMGAGVSGIQLSEETAVGKFPLEVLKTVQKVRQASRSKKLPAGKGAPVYWLTGRSGSGKTTITRSFVQEMEDRGYRCGVVDGDDFRAFWKNDAGYSKEERIRNLRNIIFVAAQAASSFDLVVVSSLSPYRELRNLAREKISDFHEIYIDCSQDTCRKRDPKGHYRKATQGAYENFVGVTEEYEVPEKPELVINTDRLDIREGVQALIEYAGGRPDEPKPHP